MTATTVSMLRCDSYDPALCRQALVDVLAPIGGLDFVQPGMRVGIKANLVSFMKPEAAATTHPVLLCALTELIRERGATVVIGDSPGGIYTATYVKSVYRATGMYDTEAAGAELNMDFGQKTAHYPDGMVAKSFQYTSWLDDCDVLIDFCKLKSHGMMGMSAAAKMMFGTIPGTNKPEYHFKCPNPADFARMLVDLDEYFHPALSIVDGIVGMDGNGPTAGDPKPMGLLLASPSPHAVDLVCAHLIGLKPMDVPTLIAAQERRLIPSQWQELDIIGYAESMLVPDFNNVRTKSDILFWNESGNPLKKLGGIIAQRCLSSVPKVHAPECIGCCKCANICPAKAIVMKNKLPHIHRGECIHCFC